MFQGKTVLITGATGLLGSNLARACLGRGAKVIALGRSEAKLRGCFNDCLGKSNFDYVAADIAATPLPIKERVDLIFHAAGSIELKTIVNKPMEIIAPNVQGTISCLEFLRTQKAGGVYRAG